MHPQRCRTHPRLSLRSRRDLIGGASVEYKHNRLSRQLHSDVMLCSISSTMRARSVWGVYILHTVPNTYFCCSSRLDFHCVIYTSVQALTCEANVRNRPRGDGWPTSIRALDPSSRFFRPQRNRLYVYHTHSVRVHTHSPASSGEFKTLRLCIQLPCILFAQSASDCQYDPSPICCHMRDDAVVAWSGHHTQNTLGRGCL